MPNMSSILRANAEPLGDEKVMTGNASQLQNTLAADCIAFSTAPLSLIHVFVRPRVY